jgi:hypothetical protein
VKGFPVHLASALFGVQLLQHVCIPSLNGLPTGDWPRRRKKNRVSRVVSGESSGIVVVSCLFIRLNACEELLGCLWIGEVFLLGVCRQSKADCQSCGGNYQAFFSLSPPGVRCEFIGC